MSVLSVSLHLRAFNDRPVYLPPFLSVWLLVLIGVLP